MQVPTDDAQTQLRKNAATRTRADLIGISIEREALRKTPLARTNLVRRPGFVERGVAQEAHLAQLRETDQQARLAYRNEQVQATRRRMRATQKLHAKRTQQQPVQQIVAEQARQAMDVHQRSRALMSRERGIADFAELGEFERARQASRAAKRGVRTRAAPVDELN